MHPLFERNLNKLLRPYQIRDLLTQIYESKSNSNGTLSEFSLQDIDHYIRVGKLPEKYGGLTLMRVKKHGTSFACLDRPSEDLDHKKSKKKNKKGSLIKFEHEEEGQDTDEL